MNGQQVPVERAAPIFQAVHIPVGEAEIRFSYQPRYIIAAYAAALLGLIGFTGQPLARFAIRRAGARMEQRWSGGAGHVADGHDSC